MKQVTLVVITLVVLSVTSSYAGWNPDKSETVADQNIQDHEVAQAIADFRNSDPSMKAFFEKAHGFAIFPTVGKGGLGIGGAYGKGKVYSKGVLNGTSSLMQFTFGFQLGGQAYREIIFFEDKMAFDLFKYGNFEFGAQVSAVAATAGVSANTDYSDGVAIFTIAKSGLMFEASVGGQKFSFEPLD